MDPVGEGGVALQSAEDPSKNDFFARERHNLQILGKQNVETGVRGEARRDGGKSGLPRASASPAASNPQENE